MSASRLRSSTYLLATHLGCESLTLIRNVVLARLLGPAEMGVAAMLAITLRFLEMSTDYAADRMLIQAEDGDAPEIQSTAHGIELLRGILSGLLLAVTAGPVASLFGQPESTACFALLGLVPFIKGWIHLDFKRWQRVLSFGPTAVVELSASSVAVAACLFVARVYPDYRAVLAVSILQGLTTVLLSHAVARRPYRVALDRKLLRRFVKFGWPLAANGLLLFGVFQGDRLIVALSCTPRELGMFAIAFQLSFIPVLIVSRVFNSIFLPILARCSQDPLLFNTQFGCGLTLLSGAAVAFVGGLVTLGNPLLRSLYGPAFVVSQELLCWLALTQAFRLLRTMSSVGAVAAGDSQQPLIVNVFRTSGLLAAVLVGFGGLGLGAIAAAGCAGELVALITAVLAMKVRTNLALSVWKPALVSSCLACFIGWASVFAFDFSAIWLGLFVLLACVLMISQVPGLFIAARLVLKSSAKQASNCSSSRIHSLSAS